MNVASVRLDRIISFCITAYVFIVFAFSGVPIISSMAIFLVGILMFFFAFNFKNIYKPIWFYFVIFYILYFSIPFFILDKFVFEKFGKFVVSSMGAALVGIYIENGIFKFKNIVYISVFAFILNIVMIFLGYNTGPITGVGRYSGLTGNPNTLALCIVLPIFFVYIFSGKFSLKFKFFTLCLAILAVYLTGTRKALFLLILLVSMFLLEVLRKSVLWGGLLASTITLCGACFFKKGHAVLDSVPIFRRVQRVFERTDESLDGRFDLISQGWQLFEESPVFGHGLAQFEVLSGSDVYAHNNYIEVAVAGGLSGLILYYSFYMIAFSNYLKIKTNIYYFIFMLALLINDFFIVSIYSRFQFLVLILFIVSSEKFFLTKNEKFV